MNTRATRRYEMLVRVHGFGATYGHLFPESTLASDAFAAVAAAIEQIKTCQVRRQTAAIAAGARRKDMARQALVNRLVKIRRAARVLAEEIQGFDEAFELPVRATDQALLIAARQFSRAAASNQARFIAHGTAATFLADLDGLAGAFEAALRERHNGRGEHVAAQVRITEAIAAGLAAVRKLDVMVDNLLEDDEVSPSKLEIAAATQGREAAASRELREYLPA